MVLFTKTCPRDAERVAYSMRAATWRLWRHVVLVDCAGDHDAVVNALRPLGGTGGGGLLTVAPTLGTVEQFMPWALEVEQPYMRQQVCKISAPTIWGDVVQIDSDMCPTASRRFATDVLRARWFFERAAGARREATHAWADTYAWATGRDPGIARELDFMGPMKGWWITRRLVEAFLDSLSLPLVDLANQAVREGRKLSEYQMLGTFAYNHLDRDYEWIEGRQPFWCHHFTSAEPLTAQQRELLARAARVDP